MEEKVEYVYTRIYIYRCEECMDTRDFGWTELNVPLEYLHNFSRVKEKDIIFELKENYAWNWKREFSWYSSYLFLLLNHLLNETRVKFLISNK